MRLVAGYDVAVADWVAAQIPQVQRGAEFGPAVAFAVVDAQSEVAAGVVFHGYLPRYRSIDVSFAAATPRWLTRPLASAIMAYPFAQLGVQRVGTHTPKRNRRAREFIDRFGFKREGLVRRGFGDDDMVISGLLVEEWTACRFNLAGSRSRNPAGGAAIIAPGP